MIDGLLITKYFELIKNLIQSIVAFESQSIADTLVAPPISIKIFSSVNEDSWTLAIAGMLIAFEIIEIFNEYWTEAPESSDKLISIV